MSVGNLKDSGNQGNNFPFQLKVLQGLQSIIDANCCNAINALLESIDNKLKANKRVPFIVSATGIGSVPDNVYSFSIANVGSAAGTVEGVSLPAGSTINYDAGVLNNVLDGVDYNATGTTFLITYII